MKDNNGLCECCEGTGYVGVYPPELCMNCGGSGMDTHDEHFDNVIEQQLEEKADGTET